MKRKTRCIQCSKEHRKCDQIKPVCGRCSATGKTCSYPKITSKRISFLEQYSHKQYSYHTNHGNVINSNIYDENYQHGRLRQKHSNQLSTLDEAVQRVQKEYDLPKCHITATSIIISSPTNRITIFEYIKGASISQKNNLDKTYFCMSKFKKKEVHEMMWYIAQN